MKPHPLITSSKSVPSTMILVRPARTAWAPSQHVPLKCFARHMKCCASLHRAMRFSRAYTNAWGVARRRVFIRTPRGNGAKNHCFSHFLRPILYWFRSKEKLHFVVFPPTSRAKFTLFRSKLREPLPDDTYKPHSANYIRDNFTWICIPVILV